MRISDWSSDVCSSDLIAQAYQTTLTRRGGRITLRGGRAEQAAHALGWFHQHSADGPLALEDIKLGLAELGASGGPSMAPPELHRKSVGQGKRGSGRVDSGVCRIAKKQTTKTQQ